MRWIAHVDMDSFYVSVERIKNPRLNHLPVVVGGLGNRAVVASASYEARKFGVRSAMPMAQARRLCASLVVVKPDFEAYSETSRKIFDALGEVCPVIEQVSVDEAYLDFTGCERLYTSRLESGRRVKEVVLAQAGLPCTVGLGSNKLVTKMASTLAKPNGLREVELGQEEEFLKPLPVRRIPGVGPKTAQFLESRGINTCGELRAFSPILLRQFLGDGALDLQRRAAGVDESPVDPSGERKSISVEETFDKDTADLVTLREVARVMSEQLGTDLRRENLLFRTLQIKLRYSDFTTCTRALTLKEPTNSSKLILENAFELLTRNAIPGRLIRLFGIGCRNFVPEESGQIVQMNLFESPQKQIKDDKVERLKDELKKKFGEKILV